MKRQYQVYLFNRREEVFEQFDDEEEAKAFISNKLRDEHYTVVLTDIAAGELNERT